MIRRLLLVVLVAAVALSPLALADHAYSHRYIVYGRVVDAEGHPVPGVLVNLGTREFPNEGPCAQQPGTETDAFGRTESRPQTNEYGEFIFCFHAHDVNRVEPPFGVMTVAAYNVSEDFRFNPYLRMSFVPIQLPVAVESANHEILDTSYTVMGRLWEPAGERVSVERVGVFGHTIDREPVNITLRLADGTELKDNTTTNNYGDFAIRFPVESRPTGGTVLVEARGQTFEEEVDPVMGITSIRGEFPEPEDRTLQTALLVGGVILGLAVVGGGAWYGIRRVSERREIEAARATSTRKRARR